MDKLQVNHNELGDFTFADIEDINVFVQIKGKTFKLHSKKGREEFAEINRKAAVYSMFDEHYVLLPSVKVIVEHTAINRVFAPEYADMENLPETAE